MKRSLSLIPFLCAITLFADPDSRQGSGQPPGSGWSSDVSGFYFGDSDLDTGGDFSITALRAKAGYSWTSSTRSRSSVEFYAEWRDYSFGGLLNPWSDVYDLGASYSWTRQLDSGWNLMLTPSVRISMASGADVTDSLQGGGIFAFSKQVSPSLLLGIGAGGFVGLEDTSAFPFLLIRWQINEQWYVGNPFAPGPVGPAGLELGYRANENWSLAVGGAYRTDRFRLDDSGLWADGFGEVEGVPVFLRSTYTLDQNTKVHFYVGTIVAGELSIDDSSGHTRLSTDYDPALLIALSWQGRF